MKQKHQCHCFNVGITAHRSIYGIGSERYTTDDPIDYDRFLDILLSNYHLKVEQLKDLCICTFEILIANASDSLLLFTN